MRSDITAPPTADDLRQAVATIIGTEPGEITGDANLVFLGLGSLEMMRLVTRWRRQGIAVEFGELAAEPTVEAWQRHLRAAWEARQVKSGEAVG
ncbi:phosphopantetheine-binding protein [Streptosporangium sp. NPDC002524]|uniref:phosphopantetheine-binding protein n=1 Tax=Streptosporangium sp. NPDC002524 TaxID=3154537 RepID=UPI00332D52DB